MPRQSFSFTFAGRLFSMQVFQAGIFVKGNLNRSAGERAHSQNIQGYLAFTTAAL
jgi:hypothetical protein